MEHSRTRARRFGRSRRAVSPILASILLIAMVIVIAAVLFVLLSNLTKNTASAPPLGASFLLGTPLEGGVGGQHWYNFTIQIAGGSIIFQDIGFEILNASGQIAHLPGSATMMATGFNGGVVAVYSLSTGTWSAGGSTAIVTSDHLSLYSAGVRLSGDRLITAAIASFSGTTATPIP